MYNYCESHAPANRGRAGTAVALAILALGACGNGEGIVGAGEPGPVAAVSVSPSSRAVTFVDDTVQLVATARDAEGRTVPGVVFAWASSDTSIITVDGSGLATAIGGGQAEVTATASGYVGRSSIRVTGPSDLTYLRGEWAGRAVAQDETGTASLPLAGSATGVVGGQATRLHLTVGDGASARELVLVGRGTGWGVLVGLADGYRGTFAVSSGSFDGGGTAVFESGTRLGGGHVERLRMSAFRAASFELSVDVSADAGTTWTPAWVMHLDRIEAVVEPAGAPSAACSSERYADFDFWRGDWDVTEAGRPSGTNRVETLASVCGLQENWKDTAGGTGISLNMFDPRAGAWTQFWVDSSGGFLVLSGGLQGASMVLEGARDASGRVVDRVTWTPNPDGSVRQLWEMNTGGAGWVPVFDGLYRPKR